MYLTKVLHSMETDSRQSFDDSRRGYLKSPETYSERLMRASGQELRELIAEEERELGLSRSAAP